MLFYPFASKTFDWWNILGGVYKLRERQTRGLQPADDDHIDEYSTPESGRNLLSDSGFSSTLEIDSDPDW